MIDMAHPAVIRRRLPEDPVKCAISLLPLHKTLRGPRGRYIDGRILKIRGVKPQKER